jgi:hypothetical protein
MFTTRQVTRFYTCNVAGTSPFRQYWFEAAGQSQNILNAACLLACAQLGAFNPALFENVPFYEQLLIQSARKSLDAGLPAATNDEMMAIVAVLSWAQVGIRRSLF